MKKKKEFNVIVWEYGKFGPYDVLPYLRSCYQELKRSKKRRVELPVKREEFRKFIERNARYQWWGRCEYEIILRDWPCMKEEEKWDVFRQVMMNIEIITDIMMEETGHGKKDAEKRVGQPKEVLLHGEGQ